MSAETIAVVLHDLPLGGTERVALRLADRWARLGRKVTILCGAPEGPLRDAVSDRIQLVACDPPIPRASGSRRLLGEATASFIVRDAPDLLFIPGNYHWPVLSAVNRLPDAVRPPVVAQISTPLFRHGRGPLRQIAYNSRTRRQLRHIDAAVALSPCMARDTDKVLRRDVTQWLRLPALDDVMAAPCARPTGRLIVAAGRLVPEKGFDVALAAFAQLGDPQARLAILGEGPERERLLAQARALGVAGRVDLPGYVSDIRPWLDQAQAFLLSSYYEGYAAVVVEALAAGCPVVATNCTPAVSELLLGQCGAVAAIGDAAGLAAGLRRVLAAPPPCPIALADSVSGFRIGPIAEAYLRIFDRARAARFGPEPTPFTVIPSASPIDAQYPEAA